MVFVYRPLVSAADRSGAHRMPGYRSPRLSPRDEWSGLWDLTAADGAALGAAAAVSGVSPGVVEVRALVSSNWTGLSARLVRELADAARARGADRLVAHASGLLLPLGFRIVAHGRVVLDL